MSVLFMITAGDLPFAKDRTLRTPVLSQRKFRAAKRSLRRAPAVGFQSSFDILMATCKR